MEMLMERFDLMVVIFTSVLVIGCPTAIGLALLWNIATKNKRRG